MLAREHAKSGYMVYVGTYTEKDSKGIYAFRFDPKTEHYTALGLEAETQNPSFVALHPSGKFLYAVNETGDFQAKGSGAQQGSEVKKTGAVSAFAVDPATGKLTLLNQVASGGADPCYLAFDKTGKYLMVANYTGGTVAVFPVQEDGRLGEVSAIVQHTGKGPNAERQEGPHAHSINIAPDNRFAVAADLGLDELISYRFDRTKGLISAADSHFVKVAPGAGPRHFTFHPSGKFAYVVSEMHSTVTAFAYDTDGGNLKEVQTVSILPKGFSGRNDAAEVRVHPSGKFLYASNRGHDSIAVFRIDDKKGTLNFVEDVPVLGKEPRNFAIDPPGRLMYVADQNSGKIVVFRINGKSGKLTPTGQTLEVAAPVCVRFLEER
jgi:6-phosphogluconolactonase